MRVDFVPKVSDWIGPEPVVGDILEVKGKMFVFITFNEQPAEGHEVSGLLSQLWFYVKEFAVPKFERFFT